MMAVHLTFMVSAMCLWRQLRVMTMHTVAHERQPLCSSNTVICKNNKNNKRLCHIVSTEPLLLVCIMAKIVRIIGSSRCLWHVVSPKNPSIKSHVPDMLPTLLSGILTGSAPVLLKQENFVLWSCGTFRFQAGSPSSCRCIVTGEDLEGAHVPPGWERGVDADVQSANIGIQSAWRTSTQQHCSGGMPLKKKSV